MRNVLIIALLAAVPLSAQQPRAARPLPAPNAELEEPFSGPLQLVELKNGDIVVHDSREKRLVVTSFSTQEQREAARDGSGPLEYRSVMAMWRGVGDSVQLLDLMQQRILVLDPSGRARRTQPMAGAGDPMALMRTPFTRTVDAQGRWYGEGRDMTFEGGRLSFGDSVVVVRTDPRTAKADSLIKFYNIVRAPQMSAQVIRMQVPGYPKYDIWGVFPDGRVMLLRANGYVPEIVLPNGQRRRAAALPYPRLPVTEADKKTMMDSVQKALDEGLRQSAGMVPAGTQMPRFELVPPEPWQTEKPPFTGDRVLVDPRNRAWVPVIDRTPGQRYDLLNADGAIVDAIKLPPRVQLLGFGASGMYTALRDADDLLVIRRHPLP
ncbi:MAG: hypothetical protein C0503_04100 [Gemmatimonas sp.]|nr:hypothetical protein [Gemmatimonas sp.]